MLSRMRPSRYIPALALLGGVSRAMVATTTSVHSLLMARLPLAVVEAVLLPAIVYVLSCWYKPKELGRLSGHSVRP